MLFHINFLAEKPLINNELANMIMQISEKYGDKIGNIGIITNGTILPNEELINISKKYDVKFDFSDYTDAVDYKKKFDEAVKRVSDAGIRYEVNRSLRWCDFGFPEKNKKL